MNSILLVKFPYIIKKNESSTDVENSEAGVSLMTVTNRNNYILQQSQFIQHLLYWTTGIFYACQ